MVKSDTPIEQNQALENTESDKQNKLDSVLVKDTNKDNIEKLIPESNDIKSSMTKAEFLDISKKIDRIENEVQIWRSKREELNTSVMEKSKIRNKKNDEVKEYISKANEEKKKRDEVNKRINELKPQKIAVDETIQKYKKVLNETEKKLEGVEEPKSTHDTKKSYYLLKKYKKEMKDLEWKLQTKSFNIKEERMIVDRIAELDEKFEELAVYNNLGKEKRKAYSILRKNRKVMRKIVKEMNSLIKESRVHHKSMIDSYNTANSIRKEADSVHFDIQKTKKEADTIHNEYVEKIKEKRKLTEKIAKYKNFETFFPCSTSINSALPF